MIFIPSTTRKADSTRERQIDHFINCLQHFLTVSKPKYAYIAKYGYYIKSLSAQSWQYCDRRKPEIGTKPYCYQMTSSVLYSAQQHRRNCKFQALEQFGALYMHNLDDKLPARPGFEHITLSEFRATTGSNEPSGPVVHFVKYVNQSRCSWRADVS